jgi:RNA polymerase sigma factor for flagellar operon FliA
MSASSTSGGQGPPDDPWEQMLVERMQGAVEQRAAHWAKRFRGLVEADDLRQLGLMGLLEAARRFEQERNKSFDDYARRWIDGKMLDAIRTASLHARIDRAMFRAHARFLAGYSDDFDRVRHRASEAERRLEALCESLLDAGVLAGTFEAAKVTPVDEELVEWEEYHKVQKALREAIAELPENQQRLLVMLYVEGFFIEEAAEALDVDRSWVNRLHTSAREALRRALLRRGITRVPPPRDGPGGGPDGGDPPPLDPGRVTDDERRRWGKKR